VKKTTCVLILSVVDLAKNMYLVMTFNSDKTEIMLFSNTNIPEFNFTFNERTIPITNSHKHLGVTFSSDAL
jgi:hypothetical protein